MFHFLSAKRGSEMQVGWVTTCIKEDKCRKTSGKSATAGLPGLNRTSLAHCPYSRARSSNGKGKEMEGGPKI